MNLITSKYKLKILIGHMLNIFKRALDIDQKNSIFFKNKSMKIPSSLYSKHFLKVFYDKIITWEGASF